MFTTCVKNSYSTIVYGIFHTSKICFFSTPSQSTMESFQYQFRNEHFCFSKIFVIRYSCFEPNCKLQFKNRVSCISNKSKHLKACLGPAFVPVLDRNGLPLALRSSRFWIGMGSPQAEDSCSLIPETYGEYFILVLGPASGPVFFPTGCDIWDWVLQVLLENLELFCAV